MKIFFLYSYRTWKTCVVARKGPENSDESRSFCKPNESKMPEENTCFRLNSIGLAHHYYTFASLHAECNRNCGLRSFSVLLNFELNREKKSNTKNTSIRDPQNKSQTRISFVVRAQKRCKILFVWTKILSCGQRPSISPIFVLLSCTNSLTVFLCVALWFLRFAPI